MTVFDPLLDVCRRGFELDAIDLGPELRTKISVRLSFSQLLSLAATLSPSCAAAARLRHHPSSAEVGHPKRTSDLYDYLTRLQDLWRRARTSRQRHVSPSCRWSLKPCQSSAL
jgi:hypothetical protein